MKRSHSRLLFSVALITANAGAIGMAQPQAVLFQAAHQSQQEGNLPLAEQQYRAFLKLEPDSVPGRTNLGVVLAQQGKLADSIEQYRAALHVDPHSLQARTDLGLAYFRSEQWARAADSFERVLRGNTGDRRCRQLLAISYMHEGDHAHAAAAFEKLLPTDDPEVLVGLAASYKDLGRTADSDRMLQMLLSREGDSSTALYLLGMADYSREAYDDAATHLKKSLDLTPSNVEAHFYLGATYFKQRDFTAALAEWRADQQLDANFFPAIFSSGALLIDQHEAESAFPLLQHAHELRPQDGNVQVALARADIDLGHTSQALRLLETGAKLLPDSQSAHFLLARTLKQLGHDREAAVEFARCKTLVAKDTASLIEPADTISR